MNAIPGSKGDSRTSRVFAALGTAIFLLVAPGIVAGLVPWWISRWQVHAPFLGFTALRVVGTLLMGAGILVLLESFGRFALQGIGTPAPVFPTRHLVHGILPLRPKSYVCRGRIVGSGSSPIAR
jgi:hypothetical protein